MMDITPYQSLESKKLACQSHDWQCRSMRRDGKRCGSLVAATGKFRRDRDPDDRDWDRFNPCAPEFLFCKYHLDQVTPLPDWVNVNMSRPRPIRDDPPCAIEYGIDPEGKTLFEAERPKIKTLLRVSLQEYKGSPYVWLQVWIKGTDGKFYPNKHGGISIRIGELGGVRGALDFVVHHLL